MPTRQARVTRHGSIIVAVILAVGMCTAVNVFTAAVLVDALLSDQPGLSENATQILTGWGGGIIGIIGALVGYQAGHTTATAPQAPTGEPVESE